MRLIDADACIDDIRNNNQQAWEALAYAPTIDAMPIVRCKDCKWAEKAILDDYCVECAVFHTSNMKHGYCNHGERREP